MVTSREGETTQERSSTSIEERQSGSRVISADNTHEPGGGKLLDCSRSRVWRIQEGMFSTYTTKKHIRGIVIHMFEGPIACTKGAMIHKAAMRRWGHKGDIVGVHQQVLIHA